MDLHLQLSRRLNVLLKDPTMTDCQHWNVNTQPPDLLDKAYSCLMEHII